MGGVNFTRNRAWWHTVIWDEYSQRYQYLAILPTFAILIPYYWHGSFLNRDIEQNFAAKMYQLDYEQKRNRLTHNLIMEHFETHVESVQDILDELQQTGFEETFKDEISDGLYNDFPKEKEGIQNHENWLTEKKAEYLEFTLNEKKAKKILEYSTTSLEARKKVATEYPRRKYPGTPFRFLYDVPYSLSQQPVEHFVYVPNLALPEDILKTIKVKSSGEGDEE
jgi:hypothetical protein